MYVVWEAGMDINGVTDQPPDGVVVVVICVPGHAPKIVVVVVVPTHAYALSVEDHPEGGNTYTLV